jgi:hypothetical protein
MEFKIYEPPSEILHDVFVVYYILYINKSDVLCTSVFSLKPLVVVIY